MILCIKEALNYRNEIPKLILSDAITPMVSAPM